MTTMGHCYHLPHHVSHSKPSKSRRVKRSSVIIKTSKSIQPSCQSIKTSLKCFVNRSNQVGYEWSSWFQVVMLLNIFLIHLIITCVPTCYAIPALPDRKEEFVLTNKQQLLHQPSGSHATLISTLTSSPSISRESEAQFDDQDQSAYQKVPVGRSVTFKCGVKNIGKHKLSWFHGKKFLALQDKVVQVNGRLKVSSQADTVFYLHIENVQLTDKGQIMCQLNTVPMKSQIHTLEVVESPHIIDQLTSANLEPVKEGSPVSLRCGASGLPTPEISWRRELDRSRLAQLSGNSSQLSNSSSGSSPTSDVPVESSSSAPIRSQHFDNIYKVKGEVGEQKNGTNIDPIESDGNPVGPNNHDKEDSGNNNRNKVVTVHGQYLNISRVDRRDMGFYVCIASNGVPTSVSRRIFLPVSFAPILMPSKHQKLKPSGRDVVLYCDLEAYPKPKTYWTFNGEPIFESGHSVYPNTRVARFSNVGQRTQTGAQKGTKGIAGSVAQVMGNSDIKYEMSSVNDGDSNNYKSILTLKIKDFQQTDYGVYVCAAKNDYGEAQARINVLPKDYTRIMPIVTTTTSLPPGMILNQHRQQSNNNRTQNGRSSPNIFAVNGAKYVQIGGASSISLASLVPQSATSNNNRISNTNNNSHDLKTNTNKYNLRPGSIPASRQLTANGDSANYQDTTSDGTISSGTNRNLDTATNGYDNDDNHLDIRLDLDDGNFDLQLQQQSSSATTTRIIRSRQTGQQLDQIIKLLYHSMSAHIKSPLLPLKWWNCAPTSPSTRMITQNCHWWPLIWLADICTSFNASMWLFTIPLINIIIWRTIYS